ncbi:MAG TPA: PQQ-binding-like beta-propeller repeat protein [Candidatus Limnocylindrales bacterium]|nr:PQQ-binding-like beta-propeller repeat protein [Candidatus Limnocylindrales bacterium]
MAPGQLADVLTYTGMATRTGEMPGPELANPPETLWQVDLSHGSSIPPLVFDGNVIVAGRDGTIRALEGATGGEAWKLELGSGIVMTPTIADDTLYALTLDGTLHAVALVDRSTTWTADGLLPQSVVTVTDGLVIAGAPGETVALSADDGIERWRAATSGSDRAAVGRGAAYAGGDGSGLLTSLALADGAERWQADLGAARVLTPSIVDDGIVVAGRDLAGGHSAVFSLAEDGTERWRWQAPDRDLIAATAVAGDRVFVALGSHTGGVHALALETGEPLWGVGVPGELQMIPVVAGDTVYVGGARAGLTALDATTGAVRWTVPLEGTTDGGIVVTGGLVIVASEEMGGAGRVIALADPADPRLAGGPSAPPTPAATTTVPEALPLDVESIDLVPGTSLLLGTAVAPDGTMYAADMLNHRIVVRDPDGEVEFWGEQGSGPGEFDFSEVTENASTTSVAVSPDGELIVVGDGGNHRVQVFDGERRHLLSIGRLGRGDRQFVNPCCVTVDADHRIWVIDTAQAEVQVFEKDGSHIRTFGTLGAGPGQLNRPSLPVVDSDRGELYVPDFANRRISVFSTDGTWLRHYDRALNDKLVLDEVNWLALDQARRMFVVDTTNQLFVIDQSGELLATYAGTAPDAGDIEFGPFVVDENGRMYVADISGASDGRLIIGQLDAPIWPPAGS